MSNMPAGINRRVLVIDDNTAIHDDFRKILSPRTAAALDATEAAVFGRAPDAVRQTRFEVDSAYQGPEGLLRVTNHLEAGQPYAMAFVDVRMPPGWDGIETSARVWQVDPDIQLVICTAYMDYSWEEMVEKLGYTDRLVILKKPFEAVEVLQLASALTEKWRLHQEAKNQLDRLEQLVRERTSVLEKTNADLTQALANIQTLSGLIPICAGCKKIRDDRGFWEQVESYLAKHSDAKFTHGICPECSRKYYPDIEYPIAPG
jgi:two-component system, sensor histidine kinase and response regulator